MLRNKEIRIFLLIMLFICSTGAIAAAFISPAALLIVAITSVLIAVAALLFTVWRYRELGKLSGYLREIAAGHYSLDIRDNMEGELSILKNEIYKVTLMLSEQGSHLQKDKIQLTNAISDISHQLKTPLTSMMVMADLLSDERISPAKRAEFTHNIQIQLERIEWLVSSLLKLSKIDAGAVSFKKEWIPVQSVIVKALEPLLIPIEIKEQTVKIKENQTVKFQGDLNWTVEALLNIIKNCVEHTGQGGSIFISSAENALFTEITIQDNGKGIAKEDLPYIFKRFYKGKNAGEESVGIGLAMAYSIITKQNGDITVSSKPGKGTQFLIKFYKQVI
ncbi:HAMP domain-containing histidine kinase [Bacillaceae bacterium Marseille-Q3522]|nr:HAMP domain-containing histidine kinase [Bacillaceae bacterium Marseille-Q3522]